MKDLKAYLSPVKKNNGHLNAAQLKAATKDTQSNNTNKEKASQLTNRKENSKQRQKSKKKQNLQEKGDSEVAEIIKNGNDNIIITESINNDKSMETSPTKNVNAFDFLMNSRTKVIGSNADGKLMELDLKSPTRSPNKQILSERKKLLQDWSNSKKSAKRKLEDDEIDKIIKVKLETRKKRFKALLNINENEIAEETNLSESEVKNKSDIKKKRGRKHKSKDVLKNLENNETGRNSKKSINLDNSLEEFEKEVKLKKKPKKETAENSVASPKTPRSWKMKIKLSLENSTNNETTAAKEVHVPIIELHDSASSNDEVIIIENDSTENKRNLRPRTSVKSNFNELSEDSCDSTDSIPKKKKTKLAPIFEKLTPKPKESPEVLEARRKFLLSGMPENLRKIVEKPESQSIILDEFPKISHVTQKDDHPFWNLKCTEFTRKKLKTMDTKSFPQPSFSWNILSDKVDPIKLNFTPCQPTEHKNLIAKKIKNENHEYPINRMYRLLKEKSSIPDFDPKKKTKRRSKSGKRNSEPKENNVFKKTEDNLDWHAKYRPKCAEDLFGNITQVKALKQWLENWLEAFKDYAKFKKHNSGSESEFMSSDMESINSIGHLTAMAILAGPNGSGKTATIYALCKELGFNVIEINASSRRTGKKLLQELQEATQSHQVKKDGQTFLNFNSNTSQIDKKKNTKDKKICIILIEDIDIYFEQDDGFLGAISQISQITKRPIILTTNDENSPACLKFSDNAKLFILEPISSKLTGLWCQLICLLEGFYVDVNSIRDLLDFNRGDVRKTILELQFWIQSGGQCFADNIKKITLIKDNNTKDFMTEDEQSNSSFKDEDFEKLNLTSHFISAQCFRNNIDIKEIWHKLPSLINVDNCSNSNREQGKQKLNKIANVYDSLCLASVSSKHSTSICKQFWCRKVQDSCELGQNFINWSDVEFSLKKLNCYLIENNIQNFMKQFNEDNDSSIGIASIILEKERSLKESLEVDRNLLDAVPYFNRTDRSGASLDYFPTLRNIAKSEEIRARNNTKRHNRFYNYLRYFNLNCNDNLMKNLSQTFQIR